jgi:glycosyltransferase involved in cell wall biosynthesis
MRIAQVAPLYESVPPKLYGGTERVVSYLTEELVRAGHEVTLFASGDSKTSARLVPCCPRALWRDSRYLEDLPHHVRQMELVFRDVSQFDVIHFHTDYIHFPFLRRQPCASVTTLHGQLHIPDAKPFFHEYPEISLVSISNDQRRPVPWANWRATVYHGLPRELHSFREGSGEYLAFLGRTSPQKGLDRAIAIARASGMKLKIAAKVYSGEREYFHRTIEPLLREAGSAVKFIGEVGGRDKDEFLGNAYALLFPIDWREPFGLVMIEAMACGTPVVAWRNGSVPEVIDDGVTGYIVDSVEDAVMAVGRVKQLDRRTCRAVFEKRFDAARMAREYTNVYRLVRSNERAQKLEYDASAELLPFHRPVEYRASEPDEQKSRARAVVRAIHR